MRVPLVSRQVRIAVAVAVAAAILASSVVPAPATVGAPGPVGLVGLDKWTHAAAYGGLAVAVAYALPARSRREVAVAAAVAVAFGLLVELVQFGVPYRSFDLLDAAANAVGAALAGSTWLVLGVGGRLAPDSEEGQDRRE